MFFPVFPTPDRSTRRRALAAGLVFALACSCLSGCGDPGRAAPVDASRAREALKTTLERWKQGDKIDALKSATPPIVAQDFDWMGGHQLLGFEVTGEGKDDDANLRIPVTLTLKTPQGKEVRKKVSYLVGTSPSLTVFRDFQ